jgi:hypothetical protein
MELVRCRDGGMAPGVIVCRHLAEGASREWIEIPTPLGESNDYLCPECFEKGPEGLTEDDLVLICLHCAREMRGQE